MSRHTTAIRLASALTAVLLTALVARAADPFADHVVYNWDGETVTYTAGAEDNTTFGPFHSSGLWNDPQAILGKPNVVDYDDTGSGEFREINVVWPAWYQGTTDAGAANTAYFANPTVATKANNGCGLKSGSQIVVEFDEAVTNDANNPYGLDFVVHGNPFFATGNMVYKDTNMNEYTLSAFGSGNAGAVFEERVTVSVAQSLDGPWYTYETAFGDWFFPTQALKWDRDAADWTDEEMDWTKPVNPTMTDLENEAVELGSGTYNYFSDATVADTLDLYNGSAGGTGFDLAESGFEWIKYVMFTDPEGNEGEICGVADLAPTSINDSLTVTWHNIEQGTSLLRFQNPEDQALTRAAVDVLGLQEEVVAKVSVNELLDLTAYDPFAGIERGAYLVELVSALDGDELLFLADLTLRVDDVYDGDGSDLLVLHWNGAGWDALAPDGYDAATHMVRLDGRTSFSPFVITQIPEPATLGLLAGGLAAILRRRKRA